MSFFRADNWLVDKGDDEAESQGLSPFGKVRERMTVPKGWGRVSHLNGLWFPPHVHRANDAYFQGRVCWNPWILRMLNPGYPHDFQPLKA